MIISYDTHDKIEPLDDDLMNIINWKKVNILTFTEI